jgi:hypothetical protein
VTAGFSQEAREIKDSGACGDSAPSPLQLLPQILDVGNLRLRFGKELRAGRRLLAMSRRGEPPGDRRERDHEVIVFRARRDGVSGRGGA